MADYFALVVLVEDFFLHHALAYCSHLRTVFRVHDGSHDVSSECRTYLVKEVFIDFAGLLVFIVADFQGRAVYCKSAGQG